MSEDNPITTWSLVLEGDALDLETWRIAFKGQSEAKVDTVTTHDGVKQYCLNSTRFDGLSDAIEVRDTAAELLMRMYGVLKLHGDAGMLNFSGVAYCRRANGQRDTHILLAPAIIRVRGGSFEVVTGGLRPHSEAERAIELAESDNNVADALEHFARSSDWYDIYKILEVILADVGGKKVLIAKGWLTKTSIESLGQTANFYRHARAPRPECPLTHQEAVAITRALMKAWVNEKLAASP